LIRLNKVCIIGSTFTAHYGGLINIQSCIDTTAETRINVLVFAHGPLLEYALAAHGIVLLLLIKGLGRYALVISILLYKAPTYLP
jgi:hypothetical protein